MWRSTVRGLLVAGPAAFLVVVAPAAALAHVTVSPDTAPRGGFAAVTLRVPNERDDASTVKVEVQLPPESPLASVSVKPHPGWSYDVTKVKLATPVEVHGARVSEVVGEIAWTARDSASAIGPGEYDEFSVSVGPLPEADRMVFKTLQHYSDGEVVRWIQEPVPGGEEPERPAPVLRLVPGTGAPPPAAGADQTALATGGAPAAGGGAGVWWAVGLSAASLSVALACLATVLVRSRRAR